MRSRQARKPCGPRSCSASRRWLGAAPKSPFLARVDARQAKLRKSRGETRNLQVNTKNEANTCHAACTHAHAHAHVARHARRHRQHTYMRQGGRARGEDKSSKPLMPNNIATDCMGRPAGFSPAGSGTALAVTTTPMGVETDAAPPGSAASSLAACSLSSRGSPSRFRS